MRGENIWILKPIGKSRGRGIQLISELSQVVYLEPMVVQKYIPDPLLIRGFKFDMRIYVLVTSFNPLEAFLYNEGFARMSTQIYNLDSDNLQNNYIHLTNVAINKEKKSATESVNDIHDYQRPNIYKLDQPENYQIGGTKISLKTLKEKLYE